jgi:threonylcarbamoyladenosine tRNA methylthiotransferase MtaB
MPQLAKPLIKARAARLRAKGASALARHLDGWIGRAAEVLFERPDFARLADYTGVRAQGAAGASARLRFTGHDSANLIGTPA